MKINKLIKEEKQFWKTERGNSRSSYSEAHCFGAYHALTSLEMKLYLTKQTTTNNEGK